jgi:hypothetical protein
MWSVIRASHSKGSRATKVRPEAGIRPEGAVDHRLLAVDVDESLE